MNNIHKYLCKTFSFIVKAQKKMMQYFFAICDYFYCYIDELPHVHVASNDVKPWSHIWVRPLRKSYGLITQGQL